jgi:hypothetical protein
MLFDLQGRRKNAVKVIYATLAILMGGGLVLFGIGGEVSGGLLDAFTGGNQVEGNEQLEDSIERREKTLESKPNNEAALRGLVRDYYQLASTKIPEGAAQFPPEAQPDLAKASTYWQRYVEVVGDEKVDLSLAGLAGQLYGPDALNRPADAQEVYRVIAERNNDVNSYAQLVSAATIAGDQRTVDLATIKALDLAPKGQRKEVQKQIKDIKRQAQALAAQAGGGS